MPVEFYDSVSRCRVQWSCESQSRLSNFIGPENCFKLM